MRLLWLVPNLNYTSSARQAVLVPPALRAAGHEVTVAVVKSGGALPLDAVALSSPHDVPMRAWFSLRSLVNKQPFDLIHTWGRSTLPYLCRSKLPIVATQSTRGRNSSWRNWLSPSATRIDDVPLAVELPKEDPPPLPAARWIVCLGPLQPERGFRDAIWAFDVLKFVVPDARLLIVGSGPEAARLQQFGKAIAGTENRVLFVPGSPTAAAYLKTATVVWLPSRTPRGQQVALEAKAAGKLLVASDLPGFAECADVRIPANDPVQWAKTTRRLLEEMPEVKPLPAGHEPMAVAKHWIERYQRVMAD